MEVKKAIVLLVFGIYTTCVSDCDARAWAHTVLENGSPVGFGIRLDRYNVLTVASCVNRTAVREGKVYIKRTISDVLDFVSFVVVHERNNARFYAFDVAILHLGQNPVLNEIEKLPREDLSNRTFDKTVMKRNNALACALVESRTNGPVTIDYSAKFFNKNAKCSKNKRRMCIKTRNTGDCESLSGGIYYCRDNHGVWRPVGLLQQSTKKETNNEKCIHYLLRVSQLNDWIYENMRTSISNEAPVL